MSESKIDRSLRASFVIIRVASFELCRMLGPISAVNETFRREH